MRYIYSFTHSKSNQWASTVCLDTEETAGDKTKSSPNRDYITMEEANDKQTDM